MLIKEVNLDTEIVQKLISLSKDWEKENISYGYIANSEKDIEGNRVFVAIDDDEIVGYLFGHKTITEKETAIYQCNEEYFELNELYVAPNYRNKGIGTKLFKYVEELIKNDVDLIMLGTATKNYKAILHFYIDELGMEFWSAALFKRI